MRNLPSTLPLPPWVCFLLRERSWQRWSGWACTPARVAIPRDSQLCVPSVLWGSRPCVCLSWHSAFAAGHPGLDPCAWILFVSRRARLLPGSSQCSFPRRPWSPEPGDLLGAGSQLAAPEGTSRHGPVNELSTPQIARPAWPPAGELQPQRRPADDLTAREAPNMLLLPIKSKGLWAWNHREHGDCASRGRRSREGTLLGRQKGRGNRGWGGGSPKTQLRPGPDPSEGL